MFLIFLIILSRDLMFLTGLHYVMNVTILIYINHFIIYMELRTIILISYKNI